MPPGMVPPGPGPGPGPVHVPSMPPPPGMMGMPPQPQVRNYCLQKLYHFVRFIDFSVTNYTNC